MDAEKPETVSKLLTGLPQELDVVLYDDSVVGIAEIIDRAENDRLICAGYLALLFAISFSSTAG